MENTHPVIHAPTSTSSYRPDWPAQQITLVPKDDVEMPDSAACSKALLAKLEAELAAHHADAVNTDTVRLFHILNGAILLKDEHLVIARLAMDALAENSTLRAKNFACESHIGMLNNRVQDLKLLDAQKERRVTLLCEESVKLTRSRTLQAGMLAAQRVEILGLKQGVEKPEDAEGRGRSGEKGEGGKSIDSGMEIFLPRDMSPGDEGLSATRKRVRQE